MYDLALVRIEHKLNLIITAMQTAGLMIPGPLPSLEGAGSDVCPVCQKFIRFAIDTENEAVVMTCGCRPSVAAVKGISSVGKPVESTKRREPPDDSAQEQSDDAERTARSEDRPAPPRSPQPGPRGG